MYDTVWLGNDGEPESRRLTLLMLYLLLLCSWDLIFKLFLGLTLTFVFVLLLLKIILFSYGVWIIFFFLVTTWSVRPLLYSNYGSKYLIFFTFLPYWDVLVVLFLISGELESLLTNFTLKLSWTWVFLWDLIALVLLSWIYNWNLFLTAVLGLL